MLINTKHSEQWGWVDKYVNSEHFTISDEDLKRSYKLYQKPHYGHTSHGNLNCRTNIACLKHLGESRFFSECSESEPVPKKKKSGSCAIYRGKGQSAGLENLGATCYINCFLQLWYHDVELRRVLFSLCMLPKNKDKIVDSFGSQYEGIAQKIEIIVQLRKMFALMLKSVKATLDPKSFLETLGISLSDQQDASEFCQLLLFQTLEEPVLLAVKNFLEIFCGPDSMVESDNAFNEYRSSFMRNRFYGLSTDERVCVNCQHSNETQAVFTHLSLNIVGAKSLAECLRHFLATEMLDGNNMVHCELCGVKRVKTRRTKLIQLPKVLYIHLMRFQWKNNGRAKSKQSISIPLVYNFHAHMSASNKSARKQAEEMAAIHGLPMPSNGKNSHSSVYHLVGAVFHVGSSSTCGHYIASIKPSKDGCWKDFNDTNVKSSTLISTSTIEKPMKKVYKKAGKSKPGPKPKESYAYSNGKSSHEATENKSCFSSSDAYVLVYVSEDYMDQYFCVKQEETSSADLEVTEIAKETKSANLDRLKIKDSSASDYLGEFECRKRVKKSPSPNDLKNPASEMCSEADSRQVSSACSDVSKTGLESHILEDMGLDLEEFVFFENEQFLEKNQKEIQDEKDGKKFLIDFVRQLENQDGTEGPHGYIPTTWLRKFLNDPSCASTEFSRTALDELLKCEHGNLSPKSTVLTSVKRISIEAAVTVGAFSGVELPTNEDLCFTCVQKAAELHTLELRLKHEWKTMAKYLLTSVINGNVELIRNYHSVCSSRDAAEALVLTQSANGQFALNVDDSFTESSNGDVTSFSSDSDWRPGTPKKRKIETSKCYVVSRNSVRDWKKLRKNQWKIEKGEQLNEFVGFENAANFSTEVTTIDPDTSLSLEQQPPTPKNCEVPTTGESEEKGSSGLTEEAEDQLDYVTSLTNEVICSHGKVVPDEKLWLVVGEDAWSLIEKYFPATEKLEPIPQIITSTNQTYNNDGRLLWEECEKCRLDAEKDASLSNHVKELLKPYDRALKELQKLASIVYPNSKLSLSEDNRRLIVVPKTIIENFRDLISDLRSEPDEFVKLSNQQQKAAGQSDTNFLPSRFGLTVDYSNFYCKCAPDIQGLTIPIRLEGLSFTKEESDVIFYFEKEYFIITEKLFDHLRYLAVQFDQKFVYFHPYSVFLDDESVESSSNATSTTYSEWVINKHLCESCWQALSNKYVAEKYQYSNKILYFVPKHRVETMKTHKIGDGASPTENREHRMNGRRVTLFGALRITVDSTDTIREVKKKLAPKVYKLASSIQILKYDASINNVIPFEDDDSTLESNQVLANDHLVFDEIIADNDNLKSKPADTDASYYESGFAGSNLLSTKSPNIASPSVNYEANQKGEKHVNFALDCNFTGTSPIRRNDENAISQHVLSSINSSVPCHYVTGANEPSVYAYPVATAASDSECFQVK